MVVVSLVLLVLVGSERRWAEQVGEPVLTDLTTLEMVAALAEDRRRAEGQPFARTTAKFA